MKHRRTNNLIFFYVKEEYLRRKALVLTLSDKQTGGTEFDKR